MSILNFFHVCAPRKTKLYNVVRDGHRETLRRETISRKTDETVERRTKQHWEDTIWQRIAGRRSASSGSDVTVCRVASLPPASAIGAESFPRRWCGLIMNRTDNTVQWAAEDDTKELDTTKACNRHCKLIRYSTFTLVNYVGMEWWRVNSDVFVDVVDQIS